jgi:folate-binding Fe-S cluster repair protein YgfZ
VIIIVIIFHKRLLLEFNKGCYVGQEPHARMFHRGHPNWILVKLEIPENIIANVGMDLYSESKKVGKITSLSRMKMSGFRNGIGMIRYKTAGSGQDLFYCDDQNVLIRQKPLPYNIDSFNKKN